MRAELKPVLREELGPLLASGSRTAAGPHPPTSRAAEEEQVGGCREGRGWVVPPLLTSLAGPILANTSSPACVVHPQWQGADSWVGDDAPAAAPVAEPVMAGVMGADSMPEEVAAAAEAAVAAVMQGQSAAVAVALHLAWP